MHEYPFDLLLGPLWTGPWPAIVSLVVWGEVGSVLRRRGGAKAQWRAAALAAAIVTGVLVATMGSGVGTSGWFRASDPPVAALFMGAVAVAAVTVTQYFALEPGCPIWRRVVRWIFVAAIAAVALLAGAVLGFFVYHLNWEVPE